jgi:hypothetical protein
MKNGLSKKILLFQKTQVPNENGSRVGSFGGSVMPQGPVSLCHSLHLSTLPSITLDHDCKMLPQRRFHVQTGQPSRGEGQGNMYSYISSPADLSSDPSSHNCVTCPPSNCLEQWKDHTWLRLIRMNSQGGNRVTWMEILWMKLEFCWQRVRGVYMRYCFSFGWPAQKEPHHLVTRSHVTSSSLRVSLISSMW